MNRGGYGRVRRRVGLAATIALTVSLLGASAASAQTPDTTVVTPESTVEDCVGQLAASVAAPSVPGGSWSTDSACLTPDSFYEFVEGPVIAKVGVAEATYADGHTGRAAVGVLTLGTGLGLAIVGVEDHATGVIKWSAVLGDFVADGETISVSGAGVVAFPIERGTVAGSLTGNGTDIRSVAGLIDDGAGIPAVEAIPLPSDPAPGDQTSTDQAGNDQQSGDQAPSDQVPNVDAEMVPPADGPASDSHSPAASDTPAVSGTQPGGPATSSAESSSRKGA